MGRAAEAKPATSDLKIVYRIKAMSAVIGKLKDIVHRLGETDCDFPDAQRDPLSHPALRAMSSRELADLPFAAGYGKRPR